MVLNNRVEDKYFFTSFFLRVGLAVVFLYAGIAAFLNPDAWVGFVPSFSRAIINPYTFLHFHSVFNILLALWLLSNKKVFYASILAVLALVGIIVFNFSALDIVFRDIAILFAALALATLTHKRK